MKIFYLPDLGEGLAEAEIREWYVKEGDEVKIDQPLVAMETAKALLDVPSPYAGKILNLHGKPAQIIKTGAPLVTFEGEADAGSVVGKLEKSEMPWHETHSVKKPSNHHSAIKILPKARVLAHEFNVPLAEIIPTGPHQTITTDDIKNYLAKDSGETLHGIRRAMFQAMQKSHATIVPATIMEDAILSGGHADYSALIIKAMAQAKQEENALNAWFNSETLSRTLVDEVHIGLAVDSKEGLIVPVIKNVLNKSLSLLREEIDHYKKGALSRTLTQEALSGATMSFSNFGSFAGRYATPIIIPPMVAILAVGRCRQTVVVKENQMIIASVLPLSLTFDHQAVTGGEAARFLRAVIQYIEDHENKNF